MQAEAPWGAFSSSSAYEPSKGLASAVTRGFYANDPRDAASFTCCTGNCTWPVFTSLSVCSACNDVSEYLGVFGRNGTDLGNIKVTALFEEGYYITHTLPYANHTYAALVTRSGLVGRRDVCEPSTKAAAFMSAKALDNPGRTLTFGELNMMLVAVGLIKAEPAYVNHSKFWNQTRSTATECALYFCTNAYRSEVRSGKLREEIVAFWSNRVLKTLSPPWPVAGRSMGRLSGAHKLLPQYC